MLCIIHAGYVVLFMKKEGGWRGNGRGYVVAEEQEGGGEEKKRGKSKILKS